MSAYSTKSHQSAGDNSRRTISTAVNAAGAVMSGRTLRTARTEPPRDCRRLFSLSYAAMGVLSSMA
jgi:hypothetical protein